MPEPHRRRGEGSTAEYYTGWNGDDGYAEQARLYKRGLISDAALDKARKKHT